MQNRCILKVAKGSCCQNTVEDSEYVNSFLKVFDRRGFEGQRKMKANFSGNCTSSLIGVLDSDWCELL